MVAASLSPARLLIDLDAVRANWLRLKAATPTAECAAVVKANAYGLGAEQVAPVLFKAGCRTFFVALPQEGMALRPVLPAPARIFVLNGPTPGTEEAHWRHQLNPVLNSLSQIEAYARFARGIGQVLPVALQIDTGMARMGLSADEVDTLVQTPGALDGLKVCLVLSHLAAADEAGHALNALQLARFEQLRRAFGDCPASLANSSGIFLGQAFHLSLVRPGAALYGINPLPGQRNPMQPVVSLSANLIQVRRIKAGDGVGYNHTWRANRDSQIATVAIGYADGLPRTLSDKAMISVAGQQVPVVGRVSMDTICADVTDVKDVHLTSGTSFQILDATLDVNALASWSGTNAYEILTRLGARFERQYRVTNDQLDTAMA